MDQKHSRSTSLSNALNALRQEEPVVALKSYALAGNGLARVLVEVTHTDASRANPALISSAMNKMVDGKMEAVAGSFHQMENGHYTQRISGLMSVVRAAVPVTEQSTKKFKSLSANMFMDDEKDMWVLRKTEAGELYVKTTGIDDDMSLIKMLDACASDGFRNHQDYGRLVAQCSALSSAVEGGDFITYANLDNRLSCGFVVASVQDGTDLIVLPVGSDEGERINKAAVTDIHAQNDFPPMALSGEDEANTVVAAARGAFDMDFLLGYYKKVYARSPAFFAQFAQRLQAHFS